MPGGRVRDGTVPLVLGISLSPAPLVVDSYATTPLKIPLYRSL